MSDQPTENDPPPDGFETEEEQRNDPPESRDRPPAGFLTGREDAGRRGRQD